MVAEESPDERVWRVGFRPNPWTWSDWKWAQDGRFHGRWDDRTGTFRTLYVASNLLGCLLEVLAPLRPDPTMVAELEGIVEDDQDAEERPTVEAGEVDPAWLDVRAAGSANLTGRHCAVTSTETVAALRPHFIRQALALGRLDFDVSALKDGATRGLTQSVSTYIYEHTDLAGVRFASRHGDEMRMWAIFERAGEPDVSPLLSNIEEFPLDRSTPDLLTAFRFHGLRWLGEGPPDGELPLPLVRVEDEDEVLRRTFGPGGPAPSSPLGAAFLWQSAIASPEVFDSALERLTVDREQWGDFGWANGVLSGLSMTNRPILDAESPDRVAHVKFIDYAGEGIARATGSAALEDVWILTLRRDPGRDNWWRVWGLTQNQRPPDARDVLDD